MSQTDEHSKIVKSAFSQVQTEEQERKQEEERLRKEEEIRKIKNIIRAHLQKKDFIREQIKKLQEEEKNIDRDIEDLKTGRLDKIEERQATNPEARKKAIIIIERIKEKYIPDYPWRSPYYIQWNEWRLPQTYTTTQTSDYMTTGTRSNVYADATNVLTCANKMLSIFVNSAGGIDDEISGTMFQNFSSGTYKVNNDKIVEL